MAKPSRTRSKTAGSKPAKATKPARSAKSAGTAKRTASSPKSARSAGPSATPAAAPPKVARATTAGAPTARAAELFAQICAAPDDRAARLVYADVLIDAGDPRGAFIAQQTALADLDPLDERYAPMLASTRRLVAQHGRSWIDTGKAKLASSPRVAVDRLGNARFANGFLQRIAVELEDVTTTWARLRARGPIEGLEVLVGEHVPDAYRTMPAAADFRVLAVHPAGWFTAYSIARVLAWGMPHLRELDLAGCDAGVDGARLIANHQTSLAELGEYEDYDTPPPFAPGQLRALVLDTCQVGDAGAQLLFASEHLAELRTLDLARCRLADVVSLEALRDAPAMRALVELSLAGNNALGPQLGALASWPVLPRLAALAVPQSTTPVALAALFPQPSQALRTLDVTSAKELAATGAIAHVAEALVRLDLGTTSLGDDRWRELLAAPSVRRIVHLAANGCSLSDAAIAALVASPLDRLVELDISSNKLTDAGLRTLAGWPGLQHVAKLRLGNNRKLTAAGFGALAGSPHFQPAELDVGKADAKIVAAMRERFGDVVVGG